MLFNSFTFLLLFLPVVFLMYYFVFRKWETGQILFLTFASLIFYGFADPSLVTLLLVSLLVNGLCAYALIRQAQAKKPILIIALVFNISLLVFFKYTYLIECTFFDPGRHAAILSSLKSIPLPIGISFFTFRAITLVVDAYRGRIEGMEKLIFQKNPMKFQLYIWFYISFFPQLLAGPISKANEFMNQIGRKLMGDIDWFSVVKYLIIGYFLKGCVADNLGEATLNLSTKIMPDLTKVDLVLLLYGFSFRMFADFAGYTYIAMGLGKLLGYETPPNFNYPYLSQSITEFWRRWHISLSTWLRNYLYIPLGGNRKGTIRTYLNLFITMFLGGLWHGAGWSYALWGSAHGIFLALERMIPGIRPVKGQPSRERPMWVKILMVFYVFNVVSILWLLFKLPNFSDVLLYFHSLCVNPVYSNPGIGYIVVIYGLPVVLYHSLKFLNSSSGTEYALIQKPVLEAACLGLMLALVLTNLGCPGQFIYFQF